MSLVVPLYNEEERLEESFDALVGFIRDSGEGSELIFVDDGSTDRTAEIVQGRLALLNGLSARLVRRCHEGKGAAICSGLEIAGCEYAAFCDVDLSTPLDDLRAVLDAAFGDSGALVIASRTTAGSTIRRPQHRSREWMGHQYNRLLRSTAVVRGIGDTQCGAKGASLSVWRRVVAQCREAGLAWDAEVVAVAQHLGIRLVEVPVAWSHDDRSKVQPVRDGLAMLGAVRRIKGRLRALAAQTQVREASDRSSTFDDEQAETLLADDEHWWFRSKASLVSAHTRAHLDHAAQRPPLLIDLGAGAGGVTAMLRQELGPVVAVEASPPLCRRAWLRHSLPTLTGQGDRVPLRDGCADVVTLLDVIEHLDEPGLTLREARRLLRPGGLVIVTVPAHHWLWSQADEFLGHRERYVRPLLATQLEAAGFSVRRLTHVFSWAVPPVWVQRIVMGRRELGVIGNSPRIVDAGARVFTAVEKQVTQRLSLPFGTSILGVAIRS